MSGVAEGSIKTCGDIQDTVGGDLCADDSAIGALAEAAGLDWEPGSFEVVCCRFCDPPAAVVNTVIPATTSITLGAIPAQGSAEEKVLIAGLEKMFEKAVKNSNPDSKVKITKFNGAAVNGRRLADAEVEFDIIVPTMCSSDSCAEKPDAAVATAMADDANAVLIETLASDTFAAELQSSIQLAADELVEAGAITSEEATASVTAVSDVSVNPIEVDDPVVGEKEDYVSPEDEENEENSTDAPTVSPAPDDDDESVDGSSSAVKVGSISVAVAAIVAMLI